MDASLDALGGIHSQVQSGVKRVLSYGSKSLSKAQSNYPSTKRELMAIVHFVKLHRHFLLGRMFLLRTDCSSLTSI